MDNEKKPRNAKYICTGVEQLRAAFNDISVFRTEDSRFMAQALLFLCEKNMRPTKATLSQSDAVEIANSIENKSDLNDGGYFEAGFIAAKTRILDALIAARDGESGEG